MLLNDYANKFFTFDTTWRLTDTRTEYFDCVLVVPVGDNPVGTKVDSIEFKLGDPDITHGYLHLMWMQDPICGDTKASGREIAKSELYELEIEVLIKIGSLINH